MVLSFTAIKNGEKRLSVASGVCIISKMWGNTVLNEDIFKGAEVDGFGRRKICLG